jgi:hypothetical protein
VVYDLYAEETKLRSNEEEGAVAVLILNSRFKCECIAGIENGVEGFGDIS